MPNLPRRAVRWCSCSQEAPGDCPSGTVGYRAGSECRHQIDRPISTTSSRGHQLARVALVDVVVAGDAEDARVVRGEGVDQGEPRRGGVLVVPAAGRAAVVLRDVAGRLVVAHEHDAVGTLVAQLGVGAVRVDAHGCRQRGEGRLVLGAEPVVDRLVLLAPPRGHAGAVGAELPVAVAAREREPVLGVVGVAGRAAAARAGVGHGAVHRSSFLLRTSDNFTCINRRGAKLLASFWLRDRSY